MLASIIIIHKSQPLFGLASVCVWLFLEIGVGRGIHPIIPLKLRNNAATFYFFGSLSTTIIACCFCCCSSSGSGSAAVFSSIFTSECCLWYLTITRHMNAGKKKDKKIVKTRVRASFDP